MFWAIPGNIHLALTPMAILASKKAGIEYLEHCAIRSADDRLVYVRKKDAYEQHFNIPNLNTSVLLLGPGTSITQPAARLCAEGNIMLGFCGGGMTPVYMASLNEYREPEYSRGWITMYENEEQRLATAKAFQKLRISLVSKMWSANPHIRFSPDAALEDFKSHMQTAANVQDLLLAEAECTKRMYGALARHFKVSFVRETRSKDFFNANLDAGNYLAYGLAACCLWVLGIPHSYPVMHGKTRRGALVFDVADIVKDAVILPNAFVAANLKESESLARRRMLAALHEAKALDILFEAVKAAALTGTAAQNKPN